MSTPILYSDITSRMEYTPGVMNTKSWAQKLFYMEVQFLLSQDLSTSKVVLYWAPYIKNTWGMHLFLLAKLFPELEFHVYDCKNPESALKTLSNVKLTLRLFNDVDAKKYSQIPNLIIISDMFRAPREVEREKVKREMRYLQKKFYELIKPKVALLKFSLPYEEGQSEYLSGDKFLPIYASNESVETRIIPNGETEVYQHGEYLERMFYFNAVVRKERGYEAERARMILQELLERKPDLFKERLGETVDMARLYISRLFRACC